MMRSSPRGFAVVITMTKGRPGADVDERAVTDLFEQLSFDVRKFKDKTKEVSKIYFVRDCFVFLSVCKFSAKMWLCILLSGNIASGLVKVYKKT